MWVGRELAITAKMRYSRAMSEKRIIDLEIKFSHQDDFIQQLNKIVTEQQARIERLEKELIDLRGVVVAVKDMDSKPPHY
jgi:SlyX protein